MPIPTLSRNGFGDIREQMTCVLARLRADRDDLEQRLQEAGRRDPVKLITGRSALDEAIASMVCMIESLDRGQQDRNGQAHPTVETRRRVEPAAVG